MFKNKYSQLEQHVIKIFQSENLICYKGKQYSIKLCDKPRPQQSGECKTDVYVQLEENSTKEILELKISCKLPSNEFQENKINSTRALDLFGKYWKDIIKKANLSIKDKFEKENVIYPNGKGRTKEGLITIGWKLEITTKKRTLSSPLQLSDKEIKNSIYRGLNQIESKKNSKINGKIINDSGIATHMLVSDIDSLQSVSDILNKLININDYKIKKHYLVYTSFSHRIKKDKNDGNRPLAVQVKYSADTENDNLNYKLIFDHPLDSSYAGKNMADNAKKELNKLSKDYISKFI